MAMTKKEGVKDLFIFIFQKVLWQLSLVCLVPASLKSPEGVNCQILLQTKYFVVFTILHNISLQHMNRGDLGF